MSSNTLISYRNWAFEINQKLTQSIYNNILCGKASSATTSNFIAFINNRQHLFPNETLELFQKLGIDYTKDTKINHKVIDNGLDCYEGNFQFIGNLIKGDSCKIELSDDRTLFKLTPITENFSIGFHQDNAPFFNQHVIHIEFSVIETISKALRSN
jgi:hypothetical protein